MFLPTLKVFNLDESHLTLVGWVGDVLTSPFPPSLIVETSMCGDALRFHGVFTDRVSFDVCHPLAGVVCGSGGKEQTPKHL